MDIRRLKILTFLMVSVSFFCLGAGNGESDAVAYLESRVNKPSATEGEVLIYEVVLHTRNPMVAGVESVSLPDFSGLTFSRSAPGSHLQQSDPGGEMHYSAVIDRFFVVAGRSGKFRVRGGDYRIGFNRQSVVDDPFWGSYVANDVDVVQLESPDVKFKVKPLPEKGMPEGFSGAVGEYDISVVVPEGEIHAGEDAIILITIEGDGDLTSSEIPDVRSMFGDGLHFKSMSESRSNYISKGNVGSEIEIECVFMPSQEGELEIKGCEFKFFNPRTFRYESVVSDPVTLKVSPGGTAVKGSPPAYMDI